MPDIEDLVYCRTRYVPVLICQIREADWYVKDTAHIMGQTWLVIQLFFELRDEVWGWVRYTLYIIFF